MTIETSGITKKKEWLSCRDVLWYLVFIGFAINYILRVNLSIAIVAMIVPRPVASAIAQCALKNFVETSNNSNSITNISSLTNISLANKTYENSVNTILSQLENTTTPSNPILRYENRFSWNEYEQGLALGGYYWLHWLLQIPGGLLARHYGTKLIFGWSNLATALLGFALPLAAYYHLYLFVLIRVLQGLVEGPAWPAMHNMTAKWIPAIERSKFISAYLGSSVGAAIAFPLCVTLNNWFGWESIFYITSVFGVVWYAAWYYLVFDTPQQHPRISETERNHILENLGEDVNHVGIRPVPWKSILTSGPLWLTAIAQCGGSWGVLTLMSEAPSYFNFIHGWDITAASVLSAAPHVTRMLFSFVFSSFIDWLHKSNKMSITNLRKLAVFVCNGIQGILLLGLAFSGCHPILAAVFMITGVGVSGSLSAGTLASSVDLSPNYASILLGFCNMFTVTAGFIAPMIVGILTNDNQTIEQWRLVFIITVVIMFASGALYMIFAKSELQPWNDTRYEEEGEELRRLRPSFGNPSGIVRQEIQENDNISQNHHVVEENL